MAFPKKLPPAPPDLNFQKATELRDALQIMLPKELGLSDAATKSKLKTQNYKWDSPAELSKFIKSLTEQGEIKYADYVLSQWQESFAQIPEYEAPTMTGAPEYPVSKTSLTSIESEEKIETMEKREEVRRETIAQSNEAVRAAIKRQQEIFAKQLAKAKAAEKALKEKEVYAREKPAPRPSEQTQKIVQDLKKQVEKSPVQTIAAIEKELKDRSTDKTIPDDAFKVAAIYTAVNIASPSPTVASAVNEYVAKNSIKIGGEVLKDPAEILYRQDSSLRGMTKELDGVFGKEFVNTVFPEYEVSETPQPGFMPVRVATIPHEAAKRIESEISVLNKVDASPPTITQDFIERWMEQMEKGTVPQGTTAERVHYQETVTTLTYLPRGQTTTWEAVGGNGVLNDSMGMGQSLSLIGQFAAQKALGKIGSQVAVKTGLKAAVTKLTTALSTAIPVPVANWIIGFVGGEVLGRVLEKINWARIKKWFLVGVGATAAALGFAFAVPALTIGGLGLLGYGYASAQGITAAAVGQGILGLVGALGTATLGAIGVPILATLIGFPVVVAIILFIINSGAYIVPQSSLSSTRGADNPYIMVTKTANPDKLPNPSGTTPVTYTVTITALKSTLSNISITDTSCKVTKKNGSNVGCPIENIPDIPSGTTVSPAAPYSFSFVADFGPDLADSTVFDTIEVTADSVEESGITTSGSETVCVGDCPTSCIKVVDDARTWPGNLRSNVENAAVTISSAYPNFAAKVCSSGEVNVCYDPSQIDPGYFAWHKHTSACDVVFNEKGVNTERNALFLLTHEVTHHVQRISPSTVVEYQNSGGYNEVASNGFCSYSDTAGSPEESMAEAAGLYASIPSWGACVGNYQTHYPRNYRWAQRFME